jgi:transcriptional regulator with XRE-family HTH domain
MSDGKIHQEQDPCSAMKIINLRIGRLIRARRRLLQISQAKLGQSIGVSFQQIHNYEFGSPVSAATLLIIAQVLGCQPGMFYDASAESIGL